MNLFRKIAKANRENQNNAKLNGIIINQSKSDTGFSLDDISNFKNAIFDVHELAIKRYQMTKSEDDAMIAIDALLAIQDIKNRSFL
ncbi:MAG: hypothetical protein ACTSO9_19665 [Candidatus Helarchaeota archaeon]